MDGWMSTKKTFVVQKIFCIYKYSEIWKLTFLVELKLLNSAKLNYFYYIVKVFPTTAAGLNHTFHYFFIEQKLSRRRNRDLKALVRLISQRVPVLRLSGLFEHLYPAVRLRSELNRGGGGGGGGCVRGAGVYCFFPSACPADVPLFLFRDVWHMHTEKGYCPDMKCFLHPISLLWWDVFRSKPEYSMEVGWSIEECRKASESECSRHIVFILHYICLHSKPKTYVTGTWMQILNGE